MNIYETADSVAQYLHFHYGGGTHDKAAPFITEHAAFNFAAQTVARLIDPDGSRPRRALDLGCSVGRSTLELSRHADSVIGSDLSAAFIDAARRIAAGEQLSYRLTHDGGRVTEHHARLPAGVDPGRIEFRVCDALAESGSYDIVHASNLLCRVPNPDRLLEQLPDLVAPGGQLALATPGSWLEEFTPRANWPDLALLDYLEAHLTPRMKLVRTVDLPFVIREHDRKFQLGVSLGTCWRKP